MHLHRVSLESVLAFVELVVGTCVGPYRRVADPVGSCYESRLVDSRSNRARIHGAGLRETLGEFGGRWPFF